MSANSCPAYDWCALDHDDPREEPFDSPNATHLWPAIREPKMGQLRTDFVFEADGLHLEIVESLEWGLHAKDAPRLLGELRAWIDLLEARLAEFEQRVRPLVRHTEPGGPECDGRGGGL